MKLPSDLVFCVANDYSHLVWRKNFTAQDKPALVGLDSIAHGEPKTMLYDIDEFKLEQLTKGIEAPVCEFVRQPSSCHDETGLMNL
jgi:hypothetical protein